MNHTDTHIILEKVGTHNLKDIDVKIPLDKITVVTGVSGSGKSSLVFDSLYAESYRRYVESLSSFARQYLKALPKPIIKEVHNLPPAIALKQARLGTSSRSTVGTMTELYDILRTIFSHISVIHCHKCGEIVERDSPLKIAKKVEGKWAEKKVQVLAPLSQWKDMTASELKTQLMAQGFTKVIKGDVLAGGSLVKLEDVKVKELLSCDVVLDRMLVSKTDRSRLVSSLELGLKVGRGKVKIVIEQEATPLIFSSELDCPFCNIHYLEPSLSLLTFNHPLGACKECQGFGYSAEINWKKVLPDDSLSLTTKGVAPWNMGSHVKGYDYAITAARKKKIDYKKPFSEYTKDELAWLMAGDGSFDGILGYFKWLDSKRYKPHYRIHAARFREYRLCKTCQGKRLNPLALSCKIDGQSIADICSLSIQDLFTWFKKVEERLKTQELEKEKFEGVWEALDEGIIRLNYLLKIGVGYLTLDRSSRTLSGGESQRINMARSLGSALTQTMFCLDEPSSGLHVKDASNLLRVIRELRDQGNTVVVVEHDQTIIRGADHLIEIGPKAGHLGGEITYAGPLDDQIHKVKFKENFYRRFRGDNKYSGDNKYYEDSRRDFLKDVFIELVGASTNNLKNISIKFPIGAITAICGVSGSGKTSLIQHTLYPLLANAFGQKQERSFVEPIAKEVRPLEVIQRHEDVQLVTQAPPGRSTRSNIATYLGVFDDIRKLLAGAPGAKELELTPGHFSFNVEGGRCETCIGLGTVVEDLSFLGEMEIQCPSCEGRRFGDKVLSINYRGKNLTDILSMTVAEAREFFFDKPSIARILDECMGLGLGYVTLGQHTSSFSGGEAQRLKLLQLMSHAAGVKKGKKDQKPSILIFDEPSTGLSDYDIENLFLQFHELSKRGFTILIVEHHLGIISSCDWVIELGPEASVKGGEVLFQGPTANIVSSKESVTGPFLKEIGSSRRLEWYIPGT